MNYEKAYKEALERIQKYSKDEHGCTRLKPEDIFPELKDSENERIRKELISYVKDLIACHDKPDAKRDEKYESWLDWLDKQAQPKWDDEDESNYQNIFTHLIMEGNSATLDANRKKWRKLSTWFKSRIPVQNEIDLDRAWEFCVNCIEDCMSRYMESWDDKSRESTYQNFLIYMKKGGK